MTPTQSYILDNTSSDVALNFHFARVRRRTQRIRSTRSQSDGNFRPFTLCELDRALHNSSGSMLTVHSLVEKAKQWQLVYVGLLLKTLPCCLPPTFPILTFTLCGLELLPPGPQLESLQTHVSQWGRRLLKWPRGTPSFATWLARFVACAFRICCLCMLCSCPVARAARSAVTQPSSWLAAIQSQLQRTGVPNLSCCGIAPNAPRNVLLRWLQHATNPIII